MSLERRGFISLCQCLDGLSFPLHASVVSEACIPSPSIDLFLVLSTASVQSIVLEARRNKEILHETISSKGSGGWTKTAGIVKIMLNDEGARVEQERYEMASTPNLCESERREGVGLASQEVPVDGSLPPMAVSITIQPDEISKPNMSTSKNSISEAGDKSPGVTASKKGFLSRSASYQEECRVCQQQTEEPLIHLGCRCRGELGKAHHSCIIIWFHTKGSNKCEICQQIAVNVQPPESQPSGNNWMWRFNSGNVVGQERERRCFSPLWVAFAILIGGLLLDVLVSVSLRVSALPVNIIIGVLIVLGLGTSFRLALECCQEWGARRNLRTADVTLNPGYHPTSV